MFPFALQSANRISQERKHDKCVGPGADVAESQEKSATVRRLPLVGGGMKLIRCSRCSLPCLCPDASILLSRIPRYRRHLRWFDFSQSKKPSKMLLKPCQLFQR